MGNTPGQGFELVSCLHLLTEVAGKAWHPLLWTSQPIMVIPQALLCVESQNEQRQGMDEMTSGGPYQTEDFHMEKLSCQHISGK